MHLSFLNFEIREITRLQKYEIIKWENENSCFVIAYLEYNKKEPCWEFHCVGTRYLLHRTTGLESFILVFIKLLEEIQEGEELYD